MSSLNPDGWSSTEKAEAAAVATLKRIEEQREILERARTHPQHRALLMVVSMLAMGSLAMAINFSLQWLMFSAIMGTMVVQFYSMQINRRIDAVVQVLEDHIKAAGLTPQNRDARR
jgi:hypothetical protein